MAMNSGDPNIYAKALRFSGISALYRTRGRAVAAANAMALPETHGR